jgi:hypothetical protein
MNGGDRSPAAAAADWSPNIVDIEIDDIDDIVDGSDDDNAVVVEVSRSRLSI